MFAVELYKKLNLINSIRSHLGTFKGKNDKYIPRELLGFLYIPAMIAAVIALIKFPDKGILDTFAICISVLIGLLLNLLVLVLSNLSSKNFAITDAKKKIRITLIEETFHNISFSVILSILTLIILFLFNFDFGFLGIIRDKVLVKIVILLAEFLLSTIFYFLLIQVFLHLFMIIKRISTIFSNDIEFEKDKISA